MTIEIAYTQHCGNNPSQQDALWAGTRVFQEKSLAPAVRMVDSTTRICIAVADGVASSPQPQKASRCVLELLSTEMAADKHFDGRLLRRIHGCLCDSLAKGKTFGASTTLVAAQYDQGQTLILSVGDSRAYHLSAGGSHLEKLMNPQLDALVQTTALRDAVLAAGAPDNFSMLLLKVNSL